MTTFNKNDIDSIDKAKQYEHYTGGELSGEEKVIFEDNLLKPNNTLDKTLLQDTAQLLENYRKSKVKVKTEPMGLSAEGNTLLTLLLKEQKGNSIPYQIINRKKIGTDQPIDEIINQFEDILFSESDPATDNEIRIKRLS